MRKFLTNLPSRRCHIIHSHSTSRRKKTENLPHLLSHTRLRFSDIIVSSSSSAWDEKEKYFFIIKFSSSSSLSLLEKVLSLHQLRSRAIVVVGAMMKWKWIRLALSDVSSKARIVRVAAAEKRRECWMTNKIGKDERWRRLDVGCGKRKNIQPDDDDGRDVFIKI